MANDPAVRLPPIYVRLLAVLMSFVVSGLGVLSLISGHTEERWTRYGHAGPLEGASAHAFGLSMFFFGLLPLALVMRTPRSAAWLAGTAAVLGLVTVFVGPAVLA